MTQQKRLAVKNLRDGLELARMDLKWPDGALVALLGDDGCFTLFPTNGAAGFGVKVQVLRDFEFREATVEEMVPGFREMEVEIEDTGVKYKALVSSRVWNGWLMPYFTKEVAEQVCRDMCPPEEGWWRYHEPDDAFYTFWANQNDWPYDWPGEVIAGQKLYGIGAGCWVWSSAEPFVEDEEDDDAGTD